MPLERFPRQCRFCPHVQRSAVPPGSLWHCSKCGRYQAAVEAAPPRI